MADLERIKTYLKARRLDYKLIPLDQKAFTVEDVKRAGVDEDEIVKTLIIKTNSGFVALAVCGAHKVDFKKVRRLFGSKSELAKPDEVLEVVGVTIGAVCPVLVGIPLYFDRKVLGLGNVHTGSGDLKHGLEMKLGDLLKAAGDYKVLDLI